MQGEVSESGLTLMIMKVNYFKEYLKSGISSAHSSFIRNEPRS